MQIVPKAEEILHNLSINRDEITCFDEVINLNSCWQRHIFVGDIDAEVGSCVETLIRFWNQVDDEAGLEPEKRTPIKIFIDSNGGDLCATFTMIDAISMSKTPVYTINIGAAYSGGFFIFIAGHKRYSYSLSTFLYHEGSTANIGDAGKFRNFADFYDKQLDMLKQITLKYTNITEEIYNLHKKDDFWMTADEALELGVCDEIIKEFIQ